MSTLRWALIVTMAAACGGPAQGGASVAPTTASTAAPAAPSASAPAATRVDGTVQSANAPIASIDQVSGSSFTVTFSGTTAKVVLGPGAVITKQIDVDPGLIPVGTKISATVRAGIAQSISYQSP